MAVVGVLPVDKPSGLTSHDVVDRVRKLTRQRRCGHTGTLDPFATGLLILCLGRATRLARFLTALPKTYQATVRFGYATDTYDRTGIPVGEERRASPARSDLERVLASFQGRQAQRPPPFSAKKHAGTRLYRLARAGTPVSPPLVEVTFHDVRLLELDGARARLEVSVSSGTYVRSLAHDIGERLALGAHLEELRRTRIGSLELRDAFSLEELSRRASSGEIARILLSPNEALKDFPSVAVTGDDLRKLRHGQSIAWEELPATAPEARPALYRVVGSEGDFIAMAEADASGRALRPILVWAEC